MIGIIGAGNMGRALARGWGEPVLATDGGSGRAATLVAELGGEVPRGGNAELVEAARRLGVVDAVTLAGMPALVSHRRTLPVLATATSRSLAQEVGPLRPDYAGPTGTQTIVQHALGAAGIPCVGLWVQVPQYVAGSPSPPGSPSSSSSSSRSLSADG